MKKLALLASHLVVGRVRLGREVVACSGRPAPGPARSLRYNSVVVWWERLSMFITAAKDR